MATVQITLPDALAEEAARAGLLTPETIASLINAEIAAYRRERRRASVLE